MSQPDDVAALIVRVGRLASLWCVQGRTPRAIKLLPPTPGRDYWRARAAHVKDAIGLGDDPVAALRMLDDKLVEALRKHGTDIAEAVGAQATAVEAPLSAADEAPSDEPPPEADEAPSDEPDPLTLIEAVQACEALDVALERYNSHIAIKFGGTLDSETCGRLSAAREWLRRGLAAASAGTRAHRVREISANADYAVQIVYDDRTKLPVPFDATTQDALALVRRVASGEIQS